MASLEEFALNGLYWFVALGICLLTIFILAREVLKRWRLNYRLENNDETLLTDSSVKIEVLTSAPEGSSFVESVPAILIENIE
ncbi:MAG: hypothetical protein QGG22_03485 [Candidatus Thalassarchaeaceae archaeon]|jgi:hypothetical protein|nr:hypothetical protein [Candidatus Thalassarchaeaceae archaeon]|tara:strand:- start:195 stop:443 length:249 start_codon:yes stop_codon:yes gene_type:complete